MFLSHPARGVGAFVVVSALIPRPSLAQEAAPPATSDAPSTTDAPPSVPGKAEPLLPSATERADRQQAQIDALIAKTNAQEDELATLRNQSVETGPSRLLSFWGFSDLTFGGVDFDHPNALFRVRTPYKPSFFSSGVNLYAKSEMTRTLSALIETRLTYTPHGYAIDWPTDVNIGPNTVQNLSSTRRVDSSARAPYSQLLYRQNGLLIERAYLEWKPKDWFGVRAGRFLTPFGIWNEDHGSPVLIGVDYPQFMNFGFVPIWQLGLQVFGSVPLADDLHVDYAVTLANSRGPNDEYKDLAAMKALGARLKLVYSPDPWVFRLGGYGYYNHYFDTEDRVRLQLAPDQTLDPAYTPSFGSYSVTKASYDDVVISADAELRYKSLRIIGEFVRQTVIYDIPTIMSDEDKLLRGVPLSTYVQDASHYSYGGYVMAAYDFPIHTRLLDFRVMPYAGYDYVKPSSITRSNTQIRGGLNVKPSPFVTLKLEVSRIIPKNDSVTSEATAVMSQLAFSF